MIMRHDITVTLRGLRAQPGFTAAVILTLGLGIAAVTSVASVAYQRTLPKPSGSEIRRRPLRPRA